MATAAQNFEGRSSPREEVHHRLRAFGPDGRSLAMLAVNLSAGGLMVRSDGAFAEGDMLRVQLPVVGAVGAEVRWVLGGRLGLKFDRTIAAGEYIRLLAVMKG